MGHISNEIKIVKNVQFANWAYLNREKGELEITDVPIINSYGETLKNISYFINNGILYIFGKQCFWEKILSEPIKQYDSKWNSKYKLDEEDLNKYDLDEKRIFKNLQRKYRTFFWLIPRTKTYDIIYEASNGGYWIKLKKELEFKYCLHPFKLKE